MDCISEIYIYQTDISTENKLQAKTNKTSFVLVIVMIYTVFLKCCNSLSNFLITDLNYTKIPWVLGQK